MRVCFFGVGGVGGYFGSIVANRFKQEHDIYFVARGSHGEAIHRSGLTLKKEGGKETIHAYPKVCTDKATDLPVCDLIVLSVKSYDLVDAVKALSAIVDKNTVVLPLLNGVDIYERIREHLPIGIIIPSCVYVGTYIEQPGVIYQKGGNCKIHAGKDPQTPDYYPANVLQLFTTACIDIAWEQDVNVSIWTKFMFIAAFGLVGAAYEKTLGQIVEDRELSGNVISIMNEIERIAEKLGVQLKSNAAEDAFLKGKQFPYEAKTSFQRDVELKGSMNEGDLFGGAILRYGMELRVATPVTERTYGRLIENFI